MELSEREGVSVRVFEPGYLRAGRSRPNTQLILRQTVKAFKANSALCQFLDLCANVGHVPTKNCVFCRMQFMNFLHAEHRAVHIEHDRESVIADELQSERRLIKLQGARR